MGVLETIYKKMLGLSSDIFFKFFLKIVQKMKKKVVLCYERVGLRAKESLFLDIPLLLLVKKWR